MSETKKKILITGTAGFIGFHLARRLLEQGARVVGLDNINDYYDVNLKYGRLKELGIPRDRVKENQWVQGDKFEHFRFIKTDIKNKEQMAELFQEENFSEVCHLAAQAGVRYSLENPHIYINSNIVGFLHILEGCRHTGVNHLVFASSSSVYGLNEKLPHSTSHNVDHPVSLYAATKKSTELMAHAYSTTFQLPVTGLRFFSVYGPWGRPDMALFKFVRNILAGKEIQVYNYGKCQRDFTYINDIVTGICSVLARPPKANPDWNSKQPDPASSQFPYKIYNIGRNSPILLMEFIEIIQEVVGKKAKIKLLPKQPGDIDGSHADVADLQKDFGYAPCTDVKTGIREFIAWYLDFYQPA